MTEHADPRRFQPQHPQPWPISEWVPWAQCNAAEFAAAGVGVA